MKIAVDIDDTLNIVQRLERTGAYIERKGLPFKAVNPISNKLVEIFDWKFEDVQQFVCNEGGLVLYTDAAARQGAKEALAGWQKLGHEVVILTSRRRNLFGNPERVSRDWLQKRHIPYDEIVAEVPLEEKGKYCFEHGISILIDDDPAACLDAQTHGVKAVLAIGRHNAHRARETLYSGASWKQIDAAVRNIISQTNRGEAAKGNR